MYQTLYSYFASHKVTHRAVKSLTRLLARETLHGEYRAAVALRRRQMIMIKCSYYSEKNWNAHFSGPPLSILAYRSIPI